MIYDKYWKALMWITIAFLVVSVVIVLNNTITTGSILKKDVDLAGGKVITVEVDEVDIQRIKSELPYANIHVTSGIRKTLLVEIPFDYDENEVINKLRAVVQFSGEPGIRIVGPALGDIFFQQAQMALIAAFVLMSLTVFLLFRTPVPSAIVLLAAVTDIVGTVAVLSIVGASLSLPVIGALLALIGYSVGTDILLTTELLKSGRSDYRQSITKAAKTGLTLTATALIALFVMFLLSGSAVIEQIALVMMIGLIIDMPATWFANAGIMRVWLDRKNKGVSQ